MMIPFWSSKAGVGCTTLALAAASTLARRAGRCTLVDLCGDLPFALGSGAPAHGVTDWLASAGDEEVLGRLATEAGVDGLRLIGRGGATEWSPERDQALVAALDGVGHPVVIDVGSLISGESAPVTSIERVRREAVAAGGGVMVVRSCYLALRRAVTLGVEPERVALIRENGRPLDRYDVARILDTSTVVEIDYDPAIAQAVDQASLHLRTPRVLTRQVRPLLAPLVTPILVP